MMATYTPPASSLGPLASYALSSSNTWMPADNGEHTYADEKCLADVPMCNAAAEVTTTTSIVEEQEHTGEGEVGAAMSTGERPYAHEKILPDVPMCNAAAKMTTTSFVEEHEYEGEGGVSAAMSTLSELVIEANGRALERKEGATSEVQAHMALSKGHECEISGSENIIAAAAQVDVTLDLALTLQEIAASAGSPVFKDAVPHDESVLLIAAAVEQGEMEGAVLQSTGAEKAAPEQNMAAPSTLETEANSAMESVATLASPKDRAEEG